MNSNGLVKIAKRLYADLGRIFPLAFYILQYRRSMRRLGDQRRERNNAFDALIANSHHKKCLQIGVKDELGEKFGPNWISVDLYDTRDFIDFNYDVHNLRFPDNEFDIVVCLSILEHLPEPERAIAELRRVLRPGGEIWVQLPFYFPYHESPKDYWRCSPDGLRVWMRDFVEIFCASYLWTRTSLVTSTFYYGRKPQDNKQDSQFSNN